MSRRTTSRALLAAGLTAALGIAALPASGATGPATVTPSYSTYVGPAATTGDAGEPSIGANWKSGAALFQTGFDTTAFTVDANGKPRWTTSAFNTTQVVSLDPIGFSDPATGRYFASQLTGVGSLMAYTDNDGKSWTTSQGAGLPAGVDHQTVGGGPYPVESPNRPMTTYPHAVYYCSQDIATAFCARSDTGGLTFGAGVPIYSLVDCGGLHGHVHVAPDGTVYVPNSGCGTSQAVAVSDDAGLTWSIRKVPGTTPGDSDPSVATGKDGTLYFTASNGNGRITVAVSQNEGKTWTTPIDIGAPAGVANTVFPSAIAGDSDRAAVAFLGTRTDGPSQDVDFGKDETKLRYVGAAYHLYVSTTYDRGKTWKTVDVTGADPVQRGRICMGGASCDTNLNDRNLLDFMGITVDRQGRVLVGWADGCTGPCVGSDLVASNPHSAQGTISMQTGGKGLFASPPPLV